MDGNAREERAAAPVGRQRGLLPQLNHVRLFQMRIETSCNPEDLTYEYNKCQRTQTFELLQRVSYTQMHHNKHATTRVSALNYAFFVLMLMGICCLKNGA